MVVCVLFSEQTVTVKDVDHVALQPRAANEARLQGNTGHIWEMKFCSVVLGEAMARDWPWAKEVYLLNAENTPEFFIEWRE